MSSATFEVDRPDALAELSAAFERYERALVSNDIEVLDELFWQDPRVVRFGAAESLYGHEAVRRFRYVQPAEDLERDLLQTSITTFGDGAATTAVEFRRVESGIHGRQTQTWIRTPAGWRIVAAHISLHPAPLSRDGAPAPSAPGDDSDRRA